MNREKYIKDKSYRTGYEEGRKEGINTVTYTYNAYLNRLEEDITYLRERLENIKAETIRMAIKALEQETCEESISRRAVLDLAKKGVLVSNGNYESVCNAINGLPSVIPQPKTGHWIVQPSNEEQGERPFVWWKCSNCGKVIYSETTHDRLEYHAFCGRCGANMVDPQAEREE